MTAAPAERAGPTPVGQQPVLTMRGVSKAYPLYGSTRDMVLDRLGAPRFLMQRRGRDIRDFYALKDVNLTVGRGERIGIVGRNGAGKSTLLKLITGNFKPTSGDIEVNGSVHALMQSGFGFNMAATGHDNIRSSLQYNGLTGAEFEEAVADVAEFVELGEFLDQPVSTYSLGMLARLQFAAATAVRPDILIVDEVMGAGDAYFSAKCAQRMQDLTKFGCTLLLVSHSPQQIIQYCDRAVWLHNGRIRFEGAAQTVVAAYEVFMERLSHLGSAAAGDLVEVPDSASDDFVVALADGKKVHRWAGRNGILFDRFALCSNGEEAARIRTGSPLSLHFDLKSETGGRFSCKYFVTIWTRKGRRAARIESPPDSFELEAGATRPVRVDIGRLALGEGDYDLSLAIYNADDLQDRYDTLMRCYPFSVDDGRPIRALTYPEAGWTFRGEAESASA